MSANGAVVLPGDKFRLPVDISVKLGPGFKLDDSSMAASGVKCGVLKSTVSGSRMWVDSSQKRATAVVNERVIGVVVGKPGEVYNVDIGTSRTATLRFLAFEGATKRNRPDVKVGDLVYARVVVAAKDVEPELSCIDNSGKSDGMGQLQDGYSFVCTLGLCRKLLRSDCAILAEVGKYAKYEIAIGLNGRVWIKSDNPDTTMFVCHAIENSEFMTTKVVKAFVKEMADRYL